MTHIDRFMGAKDRLIQGYLHKAIFIAVKLVLELVLELVSSHSETSVSGSRSDFPMTSMCVRYASVLGVGHAVLSTSM